MKTCHRFHGLVEAYNLDRIGCEHGWLTFVGPPFYIRLDCGSRATRIVAKCRCGNVTAPLVGNIYNGSVVSCGCKRQTDASSKEAGGVSSHPLYMVWRHMIRRCEVAHSGGYKRYGARGIRVCDEWRKSFPAFIEWAVANGWQPGLEIDRENNDDNYEPGNCRFVTGQVNSNNKRNNRFLSAFGETKSMCDWSRDQRCKVTYQTLRNRIGNLGWTNIEFAIATPSLRLLKTPPEAFR